MAVSGRQNPIRYLAAQPTMSASDPAMFISAKTRACSTRLFCLRSGMARSVALYVIGLVGSHRIAMAVCSAVRCVLFFEPTALASLKSRAYRSLASGGGPGKRNSWTFLSAFSDDFYRIPARRGSGEEHDLDREAYFPLSRTSSYGPENE